MTTSPSPLLRTDISKIGTSHIHISEEVCPLCEQRIPGDRYEEIKERIQIRERERMTELKARLQTEFAREKSDALEQAQQEATAALDRERDQAAEREAVALLEGRKAGEQAAQERLAVTERINLETQAEMQSRIEQSENARVSAEQLGTALRAQLDKMNRDNMAAINKIKQDAAAREHAIHIEAREAAEMIVKEKLTEMERVRQESEASFLIRIEHADAARIVAQETGASLQAQIDQICRDNEVAINKVMQDAADREIIIRREAISSTQTEIQGKLAGAEQAKAAADIKAAAAEEQVRSLQETHKAQLAQRLLEQREVLEREQTNAVNAEKSAAFEEKLKLSAKVEDLQRVLDKKTAEELGEGAEIDLFEVLKAEFNSDRIERIDKGLPGADIRHIVIHNGKECGTIVYDSKNHNAWRNEFVSKLAADKMAAKAEHAILSTRKFPAGARHLYVQDGIVLAAPSRVAAVVQILRQHLVQTHTLRLSNEARTQKTAALYRFITSERFTDLFARIDTHADDLLELQVKEKKAHDHMWKRQGELLRSVQKVRAEICNEIEIIIGTAENCDQSIPENGAAS